MLKLLALIGVLAILAGIGTAVFFFGGFFLFFLFFYSCFIRISSFYSIGGFYSNIFWNFFYIVISKLI